MLNDGDHPPNDHTISKEDGGSSKEAKEAQNLVKNVLNQYNSAPGSSPGNWPGLGCLLEQTFEGIISCTLHPSKA